MADSPPLDLAGATLAGGRISAVSLLNRAFAGVAAEPLLRFAIEQLFRDRIALVSSFGAESAVLLHMAARIAPALPVLFLDTGKLFPETLAYRDRLVGQLGLSNVRTILPDTDALEREDASGLLHQSAPDECCRIRKVEPLAAALAGYEAWITGRKRFQVRGRQNLRTFDEQDGRIKLNPLADWSPAQILAYVREHDLPEHPLVADGYSSIGCLPCTSRTHAGEDVRAGRWRGLAKSECGLHQPPGGAVSVRRGGDAIDPGR